MEIHLCKPNWKNVRFRKGRGWGDGTYDWYLWWVFEIRVYWDKGKE